MGKKRHEDRSMLAVRERFKSSGMTLDQLGLKMGYAPGTARQSAWQFIHAGDPQISTLRRFAEAMGITLSTLLKD